MEDLINIFLDDDQNRAALLHQRMPAKELQRTFWVKNVEETLDLLINYRERLQYVSLDHDLGGESYVHPGREDCGMEVVRWLERQDPKQYDHVAFIIHSHNEHSGKKMAVRLIMAGYRVLYAPFGTVTK